MVSNYKPNACTYRIDKLDNVVYLIPEQALRNIKIDNGEAYVENIQYVPIMFHCYNISLEDTDTLDERYEFTHTLKFSVNGYANHNTLAGNYYAIVRSVDNEYWLVNPMFPCKVTYTYKLGYMENHTDFTLSTISNHPTLRVHGMNQVRPYPCKTYNLDGFDRLFLNEKKYSVRNGNDVNYTNSGFCEVVYDKKSASFSEQFDGTNVSHSIQFHIKFDDYKDSWHYNLLEFTDNLYSSVISTKNKQYVLCGFHFGLQPSYTVTSNGESTPDYIDIRLADMHDNGNLITFVSGGTISGLSATTFQYTTKFDSWECVSDGVAQYILKEEIDALGNQTGNYMCLEGYEEQFAFLGDKLVGTFDETDTFTNTACNIEGCNLYTSLDTSINMLSQQCKMFSLMADSDWSITNNADYLQFTPTSGSANTEYSVSMCNTRPQSASSISTSFTINYCSTSAKTFTVNIGKGSGCFYVGDEFNISPSGQYVTIPIDCCVSAASETTSALTNIQIFDNYIRVYVPQNTGESARTFTLDVTICDGTDEEVTINQTNGYERWVTEGYTCLGKMKCEVQRKYTGTTSGDINTWTEVVRTTNCVQSSECGGSMTRWVDSEETVCYMGRKYIVQVEQVKPSTSSDWINTGNQRRGDETPDSPAECSGTTLEEWRVDTSEYICDDTTKYEMMRLYVSYDSGTTWTATDTTKKGVVIEHDSEDCGYVPPSGETYYEWRIEGTQCDGFDLYNWEQKYVSSDGNTWSPTGTYRYGSLIETNSSQCGYVPPIVYEYQWSATTGYVCSGTNKMTREIYQRRISGSSDPWENVVPTQERAAQPMIESASTDCGYVPPVEPMYKWVTISINQDYVCDECPMHRTLTTATTCVGVDKYELDEYQVSYDSGTTWTTTATSATTLIEADSEDCGYVPPTPIDYSSQYLTFVAREDGTFRCIKGNSGSGVTKVKYSLDSGNTWSELYSDYSSTPTVTAGSKIMWKSAKNIDSNYGSGRFTSTGKFDAEGNPLSMFYGDDFIGKTNLGSYPQHFYKMFMGNTNIVNAQNLSLPLTSVGYQGCLGMFSGCTSLETAPVLSATTLSNECYSLMFYGCSSLATAPELPATVLGEDGTSGQRVYDYMFANCTSLTTAPELPASTLRFECYYGMFSGCTSLNSVVCLATDISASNCTYRWLYNVSPTGTFTKASSMTSWTSGSEGIPSGWTVTNYTS